MVKSDYLIIVIYLGLVYLHGGLILSDINNDYVLSNNKWYRKDLAISLFCALIPIVWIIAPFLTGFYEHGWRLKKLK